MDYLGLYASTQLTDNPDKLNLIKGAVLRIIRNENRYKEVATATGIPHHIIGVLHYRESKCNFRTHLHNGDPLTERTVHVPIGRPVLGEPPFEWVYSAIDAFYEIWRPKVWSLEKQLEFCERYNGLGYRKQDVNSPYLWNYTNHYEKGLFVADGKFNPDKVDANPGCVALLKYYEMQ